MTLDLFIEYARQLEIPVGKTVGVSKFDIPSCSKLDCHVGKHLLHPHEAYSRLDSRFLPPILFYNQEALRDIFSSIPRRFSAKALAYPTLAILEGGGLDLDNVYSIYFFRGLRLGGGTYHIFDKKSQRDFRTILGIDQKLNPEISLHYHRHSDNEAQLTAEPSVAFREDVRRIKREVGMKTFTGWLGNKFHARFLITFTEEKSFKSNNRFV